METDFLVIGSGIAGLWFALRVAERGEVLIATKKSNTDSNTNYAQGGIAAALGCDDSPDLHFQDTIRAGEGLCHEEVVRAVAQEGPKLVEELYQLGVGFDTYQDAQGVRRFQLGREGGHLRARIVHARDRTGQEVENGLVRAVKQEQRIRVLENHFATDLLLDESGTCVGCELIDEVSGRIEVVRSRCTLLATGGIGRAYYVTTNPPIATGDGIAMAFRAGARIANMEFVQFHPTALYGFTLNDRAFLISETLRGEGALLRTRDGATFMERYHELGSLAPRDVVARAIDAELKKRQEEFVVLDATHLDPERLRSRFPTIYEQCLKFGIDITREPIPVVPAAHYVCGGVAVDLNAATSIPRLFAAGECACTGLHGANRLASNSLLEALVFAEHAARAASGMNLGQLGSGRPVRFRERNPAMGTESNLDLLTDRLRRLMSQHAAIVRTDAGLKAAEHELAELFDYCPQPAGSSSTTVRVWELRNMLTVARLVVRSALSRKESRGLHFNQDYPGRDDVHFRHDTILTVKDFR